MVFPPDIIAQLTSSVQGEFSQLSYVVAMMVGIPLFFWFSRQTRGLFLSGKRNTHVTG